MLDRCGLIPVADDAASIGSQWATFIPASPAGFKTHASIRVISRSALW